MTVNKSQMLCVLRVSQNNPGYSLHSRSETQAHTDLFSRFDAPCPEDT